MLQIFNIIKEQKVVRKNQNKTYSKEFKDQILKECFETNKYSVVAEKHGLPATTVYTWIRSEKNKDKRKNEKSERDLKKENSDLKLENEILKELLKKTNLLWMKE